MTSSLPALAEHSRFVQRVRRRYAAELSWLPPGVPDAPGIATLVQRLQDGGRPLATALRVARQRIERDLGLVGAKLNQVLRINPDPGGDVGYVCGWHQPTLARGGQKQP